MLLRACLVAVQGWVGGNRVVGWGWWAGGDRAGWPGGGRGMGRPSCRTLLLFRWEAPHGARARVGVALVAWPGLLPAAGLYIRPYVKPEAKAGVARAGGVTIRALIGHPRPRVGGPGRPAAASGGQLPGQRVGEGPAERARCGAGWRGKSKCFWGGCGLGCLAEGGRALAANLPGLIA